MKYFVRMLLVVAVVVFCAARGSAKTDVIVNLADSAEVYHALYDNTPIEPEFKIVPRFAIVGADGKFVFSIGASMKFTMSYDWGNPVTNPNGMGISEISPASPGNKSLFQMSAGGSGIYFNIIGFPNTAKQIGLFISIGVDNENNNTYKLSAGQIYMRYRDLQLGYATSLYNDRRADTYTIDSHGPCASGAHSAVGINWQHYFNKHIRVGLGVELAKPSYYQYIPDDMSNEEFQQIRNSSFQNIPDFPLYVGYDWGRGHVRLSGVLRNIHYVNMLTNQSHNRAGWGLKLTGNADLGPVGLFWMAQGGRSLASYFNDNSDRGLDLVPCNDGSGNLCATHSWGTIVGMQYNYTSRVFSTVQVSYLRNIIPVFVDDDGVYNGIMKHGVSAVANVVWKISSLFSTGLEYRYGRRIDETGKALDNNRLYAMFMMNF